MLKSKCVFCLILLFISSSIIVAQTNNKKVTGKSVTIGLVGKSKSNPVFVAAYAGGVVLAVVIPILLAFIAIRPPQTMQ